jgi:hypothetical protein
MEPKGPHYKQHNAQVMPLILSSFCVSLRNRGCGGLVVPTNLSRLMLKNISHAAAQRRKALPRFQGFSLCRCAAA